MKTIIKRWSPIYGVFTEHVNIQKRGRAVNKKKSGMQHIKAWNDKSS